MTSPTCTNIPAAGEKCWNPFNPARTFLTRESVKRAEEENETEMYRKIISFSHWRGNQNCGKTTLFNQLTGSNQHVGNFPGVTVDRKSGMIKGYPGTEVVDLPGIYSLSPYTSEEIVSRQFILEEKPSAIINIIDATNIERNLYLTMQLLELNVPIVIALNMMDEMTGNGGSVLINEMEEILQVPVIPTSAAKNQGVEEWPSTPCASRVWVRLTAGWISAIRRITTVPCTGRFTES